MAVQLIRDSRLPLHSEPAAPSTMSPFLTLGEYTVMPMEFCTEEQVATLFAKVCQRGNPVLQGRPMKDVLQLGRAMYRKCAIARTGTLAMYQGEPVALGCGWDMEEGGVWVGSGLEMPASMAAHAACGKACFESFQQKKRAKSTYFAAFYGVSPPHSVKLFGYLGFANFGIAHKLGFEDSFQFTLIPTLTKRGLFAGQDVPEVDTMNYPLAFANVPCVNADVHAELEQLGGTINISLTRMGYIMSPPYKKMAAAICGMKADDMCVPADLIATNHLKWLQSQSSGIITSRI